MTEQASKAPSCCAAWTAHGVGAEEATSADEAYEKRLSARKRDSRERLVMAALTGGCLACLLIGFFLEKFSHAPSAVINVIYGLSYICGGWYATGRALEDLRSGKINIDLLMVFAALGAAYVDEIPEGAVLLFLFSLSGTLERFIVGWTKRSVEALLDLSPEEASLVTPDGEKRVPVGTLLVSDVVIVRPGERIPVDGLVVSGTSTVDQAAMTGESIPISKKAGDTVFAGTLNQLGALELQVTARMVDSAIHRIIRLVEQAQSRRAGVQRFSDWFGQWYTLAVLGVSFLSYWYFTTFLSSTEALYRAMTILVVASPCAVVVAAPAALLAAITRAARNGVLLKGGEHLEALATIDSIAVDKTGTLTEGRPVVVSVTPFDELTESHVLEIAAAAEIKSEHPLGKAIVNAAIDRALTIRQSAEVGAVVGKGFCATVEGRKIFIGKPEFLTENNIQLSSAHRETIDRIAESGATVVVVADSERVLGAIGIADKIRETSFVAVKELQKLGISEILMITGDNAIVAAAVAKRLDIESRADLLPEEKLKVIQEMREKGRGVVMVGDGINDAPSLAEATVGIAMGGNGTDVALETADVVLMSGDMRLLPFVIRLARKTRRVVLQNFLIAFGAMTVLLIASFSTGIKLPLAVAGHEGSTVIVILNGLRLLRFPVRAYTERDLEN